MSFPMLRCLSPRTPSKVMHNAAKRFVQECFEAGAAKRPKFHLLLHVAARARGQGSPRLHATWQDETLNRLLAACGASAHRLVWHLRTLAHFEKAVEARAANSSSRGSGSGKRLRSD